MKTHELKSWPEWFEQVWLRRKAFELRKDDGRDFQEGDMLRLREWHPKTGYSGREIKAVVTYLLRGPWSNPDFTEMYAGLRIRWVIMSLKEESRVQASPAQAELITDALEPTRGRPT